LNIYKRSVQEIAIKYWKTYICINSFIQFISIYYIIIQIHVIFVADTDARKTSGRRSSSGSSRRGNSPRTTQRPRGKYIIDILTISCIYIYIYNSIYFYYNLYYIVVI